MKAKHLLLTCLLAIFLPMAANAYDAEIDGIYYNFSGDEATVTYQKSSYNTNAYSGDVVIPESVTYSNKTYSVISIGDGAFYSCSGLTSITIPNSVTSIGDWAFRYCSGLTSVTIPNSVTSIGESAFMECTGLTSVTIGEGVTTIGKDAFEYCSGLTSVTIPNSVTNIGDGAFFGCTSLESIKVNEGNNIYDSRNDCNAIIETSSNTLVLGCQNTVIPDNITSIGYDAFCGCSGLTSITIPNSVTTIGQYAFRFCSSLTSVTIPDHSVTTIQSAAFEGCSNLTSITIPKSVNSIGGSAFRDCSSLTSVTIPEGVTIIDMYVFHGCSGLTSVTIPKGVTIIDKYAFNGCSSLTSITIPGSVTSIGENVFYGCSSLTSVTSEILQPFETGTSAFWGIPKNNATLYVPGGTTELYQTLADWNRFTNFVEEWKDGSVFTAKTAEGIEIKFSVISVKNKTCKVVRKDSSPAPAGSITIPESVKEFSVIGIDSRAFYGCTGLTSVTIGNSVTSIGNDAFSGCSGLTSVTIPNSVTSIGDYAFSGCTGLTSVSIGNSVTSIGSYAFYSCSSLTSITIPNSVTSIGNRAFQNCFFTNNAFVNNSTLTSDNNWGATLYDGEETSDGLIIENGIVVKCRNWATSVTIPISVTSIRYDAFHGCTGLTSVIFHCKEIGSWFQNESSIKEVIIGNEVTSIGSSAFYGCSGLTSVTIGNSVTRIGSYAFYSCSSLTSITIPNSVTSIGSSAFYGCSDLTSITIGNGMTQIREEAFADCTALTDVYCHAKNVPNTNSRAFAYSSIASATLHVPAGSINAYRTTAPWSNFGTIVILPSDDIEYVTNLPSNKWSGAEYTVQAISYDSGYGYGDWNESSPNYNKIVGTPEADANGRNWYDIDYSCNWEERTAPLNNWCQNFGDIYVRRAFYYDSNMPAELYLACGHDDAPCEYYLNGELIWSETDGWFELEYYKLTEAQKALLRPGELNVLAFHVHQNWGGMYADGGLYTSLDEMGISNQCGDNLSWTFDAKTGTLTITGTGDMYGYNSADANPQGTAPWAGLRKSVKHIALTSGITSIGKYAFHNCRSLESVSIPESVTSIGERAFYGCVSLVAVTLPTTLTSIGTSAFDDCYALAAINIPDGVTFIGDAAFSDCRSLTSLVLPDGIPSVGNWFCDNCTGLTTITIPNSVTSIGTYAFYNCSGLKDVRCFAENVPSTNSNAFSKSNIASATLHVPAASLEAYRTTAPWSNFGTIVALPSDDVEYVTYLPSNKWSGAKYTVQAISYVSGNRYGNMTESNPNYNQIMGAPEADANGRNWYDIDYSCNWAERTAPLNNWCQSDYYGDIYVRRAFSYDSNMPEELYLACGHDDAPCEYYLNGELLFSETDGWFELEYYKLTKAQKALLKPGDLNVLAFHVHQNWGGMYADGGLYASLEEMGISKKCGDNLSWTFDAETGTLTITGTGDMYGYNSADANPQGTAPWAGLRKSVKHIVLPPGITSIGKYAFHNCRSLESVTIPESVTRIGDNAFTNCNALSELTLNEGLKNIGTRTFQNTNLKHLVIPNSVEVIGGWAFENYNNNPSLESVVLGESLTTIEQGAFQKQTNLTKITSLAVIPPTLANYETFANYSADLYVPLGSEEAYRKATYWKNFYSISPIACYVINDETTSLNIETEESGKSVTFTHEFNGEWEALYLPFAIDYDAIKADFDLAEIDGVVQTDDDNDGIADITVLGITGFMEQMTAPNTPYLIRAKNAGEQTLQFDDVTVYPTEEATFDCSTFTTKFEFTGSYNALNASALANRYVVQGGELVKGATSLAPCRWYMTATSMTGGSVNLPTKIRIMPMEEVITGSPLLTSPEEEEDIYNLAGQKIVNCKSSNDKLPRGIYIVGGKKLLR